MKRTLFYAFIFIVLSSCCAEAAVTVNETTDTEYLINSGYSQAVAEDVFMQKNRVAGKPVEPLYEKSQNKFVKGWYKFWAYIDPARDEEDRIHHDINLTPSYTDL